MRIGIVLACSIVAAASIIFLVIALGCATNNVMFLNEVREKEGCLYPLNVDGVQVSLGGLKVESPEAFGEYYEKWAPQVQILFWHKHVSDWSPRDLYLSTLKGVGSELNRERLNMIEAGFTKVRFSVGGEIKVRGLDDYVIALPIDKLSDLASALYDIAHCAALSRECQSKVKEMDGAIGWASHSPGSGIDALDTAEVVEVLENFSSILDTLRDKCGKEVVWIYNDSWNMPTSYGVSSLVLSLPPTNGKWQAITSGMIVPPNRRIVVNLAAKNFDALVVGIDEQLKGGGKK